MSTSTNGSLSTLDLYTTVTDKIIVQLEQGTVPWRKPWADAGIPMNLLSKRPYRGINLLLLMMLNYEKNLFLTFDQLKKIGGNVKKGEHGHIVIFWKSPEKNPKETEQSKQKQKSVLRYYKVWNVSQCENIPEKLVPVLSDIELDPIQECETIVQRMPDCPAIVHKKQQAFYDIAKDIINMPQRKTFKTAERYYSTLFHELIHSTGHEKRLNRKTMAEMSETGGEAYSFEELVAELGACYLCNYAAILDKQIANSAAYLEGWLQKLNSDKRFIVFAAAQAQKATDYILNLKEIENYVGEEHSTTLH